VEQDRTNYWPARPTQTHRPKTHRPTRCLERDYLPYANRLPVEQFAQMFSRRQLGPPHLSTLDTVGSVGPNMGSAGAGLSGTGRSRLAMAGSRYGSEQGAFWGDQIGPNPTAWLSKCRAILVRYEKKSCNYLGLIKIACALLWYRRFWRLSVLR